MILATKLFFRRLPLGQASYNNLSTISKPNKVYESSLAAVSDMKNGSSVFFGGFGPCGLPENLITAVYNANIKNLNCVTNNPGMIHFARLRF